VNSCPEEGVCPGDCPVTEDGIDMEGCWWSSKCLVMVFGGPKTTPVLSELLELRSEVESGKQGGESSER
jgi:hypothetical protein